MKGKQNKKKTKKTIVPISIKPVGFTIGALVNESMTSTLGKISIFFFLLYLYNNTHYLIFGDGAFFRSA